MYYARSLIFTSIIKKLKVNKLNIKHLPKLFGTIQIPVNYTFVKYYSTVDINIHK